jgi:hypothetical protein
MHYNHLWDEYFEEYYINPKVLKAEELLKALKDYDCPPLIYELLKLLVEDLRERKE